MGNATDIHMTSDQDVTIDPNAIPGAAAAATTNVVLSNSFHVYRVNINANSIINLSFDSGYGGITLTNDMLQFEVHVRNTSTTSTVNATPTMSGRTVVPLTDDVSVPPGQTNVYAIRIGGRNFESSKVFYSLAYQY